MTDDIDLVTKQFVIVVACSRTTDIRPLRHGLIILVLDERSIIA
jgi:hypothetical protein